jgi:hypothetical protein
MTDSRKSKPPGIKQYFSACLKSCDRYVQEAKNYQKLDISIEDQKKNARIHYSYWRWIKAIRRERMIELDNRLIELRY